LEHAGYDPGVYKGKIGLYAGASPNLFWEISSLKSSSADVSYAEQWEAVQFSDKDYLSTRIGYKLDLKGPCVTLQTACSTSLAAVVLACRELLSGACDMALAGGVSVTFHDEKGYVYQEGGIMSPDGLCRAFDARARGTVGGNGAGVVVLKPLDTAITDRDCIHAVIKGFALNNDGKNKVGFTAPGVQGQAEVIGTALQAAGIEPESIGYIEAHGTGTPMGDPIEIEGLKLAFKPRAGAHSYKKNSCAVGSVKTNIGHLDAAAGAVGLIKTVLALKHRMIPPSLHFETPNPKIDFENSPFYVNTELKEWKNHKYPLRAGVSSFGIGGTNAHVILEESPKGTRGLGSLSKYHLILLSAKTQSALDKMTENLAEYFKKTLLNRGNHENPTNPGPILADAAYTLQVGRKRFPYRRMLVCSTVDEAIAMLSTPGTLDCHYHLLKEDKPPVVFMFPGQGSQYVNMGRELYEKEPVFRQEMDRCFEILKPLMGYDIKEILYPSSVSSVSSVAKNIDQTEMTQPLLFAFEYTLAKLLVEWGIKPDSMIGHSIGEYTAACLSGIFSPEEALKLVVLRGRLVQRLPGGAMLSAAIAEEELVPLLKDKALSLAAVNSPSQCVVSGTHQAVEDFARDLKQKGYDTRPLHTSHAFHSYMMDPVLEEFKQTVIGMKINFTKASIPFISNVTGKRITVEEASNPDYWVTHLRRTVRFNHGLAKLFAMEGAIFVEVGPGRALSTFARQYFQEYKEKGQCPLVINLVRHPGEDCSDCRTLFNQIGRLWLYGIEVDWPGLHRQEKRYRIPLTTYPFEGKRFPVKADLPGTAARIPEDKQPLTGKPGIADWFYTLVWDQSILAGPPSISPLKRVNWLIFVDSWGLGSRLLRQLEEIGSKVTAVRIGQQFQKSGDRVFTINPQCSSDYDKLFRELKKLRILPGKIVHLWGITGETGKEPGFDELDWLQDQGFYSLLNIVRAAGRQHITGEIGLEVLSDRLHNVTGDESIDPLKATILGPVKVIPLEYPNITCRSIDIVKPTPGSVQESKLPDRLLKEFALPIEFPGSIMALRGNHRWVRKIKPIPLEKSKTIDRRLKKGGVYLVTGGLGGIGMALAQYLAERVKARLILVDPSALPPAGQWERKLQQLKAHGAEIMTAAADVSDIRQMKKVIARALERFGTIDGVIHAAGVVDYNGVIQARTKEMTESIMAPKVKGTLVLDHLLKNIKPDFIVLCSSLGNITRVLNFGQVGYTAANEFLDAYAHWKNTYEDTFTVSINWPTWQGVGMGKEALHWAEKIENLDNPLYQSILDNTISSRQGIEAFCRILSSSLTRAAVSPKDLNILVDRCNALSSAPLGEAEAVKITGTSGRMHPRPQLSTAYIAPREKIEKTLANTWQEFFKIEPVGIRDNFFELGGDSLKAIGMASRIHKELNVEIPLAEFFSRPSIETLARYITDKAKKEAYSSIKPAEKKEYYILSSAQKRLFVLQQMVPGTTAYNISCLLQLEGSVKREKLEAVFSKLIQRFESFGTSFVLLEGQPVQRIHHNVEIKVEVEEERSSDLEGTRGLAPLPLEPAARSSQLVTGTLKNFIRPFDLSRAPLLRIGLTRLEEFHHILIIDMHHIIADGTSINVLMKDFKNLYAGKDLPHLEIQYKDFSEWQNREQEKEEVKQQRLYWSRQFQDDIPVLNLPLDFPRPPVQSFAGNRLCFDINKQEAHALKTYARDQGITLYLLLLSVYVIFLAKLSNQEDIVIGTPISIRKHANLENIIGMFANTLALRNFPGPEKNVNQFLDEVKERTLGAFANQDYPFEELVETAAVERNTSRNPLFDTMFVLQNFDTPAIEIPGLKLKPMNSENLIQVSKFDLTLEVVEIDNRLFFFFEYSTKLFKKATIERFIRYFKKIVSAVPASPKAKISGLEIISDKEKKQVLYDFNNTASEYPGHKMIHELFAEQTGKTPDQIALKGTRGLAPLYISYRELNEKASQLAHLLIEKGVKPDTLVAIMMERSIEMIVGILAILKAGGAYLPIDPAYPWKRIQYVLADSNTKILLTTPKLQVKVKAEFEVEERFIKIIDIAILSSFSTSTLTCQVSPTNLAYVMYTSGSTGRAKAVIVEHRSVVRLVKNTNYIEFKQGDRILQTGALDFDASTFEIWGALLNGLLLYLVSKETILIAKKLEEVVQKNAITTMWMTSPLFNRMVDEDLEIFKGLRDLIVGGDLLSPLHINRVRARFPGLKVTNGYGPTENTTFSTTFLPDREYKRNIPIGKPIANSTVYIMDNYNNLQPIGVPGELCVGGDGLARGYLNNVELTAQKFQLPNKPGYHRSYKSYKSYILYHTGDSARWLSNGNIEFLGRTDFQVKIRGYRIEPGEIETHLLNHDKINEIVVTTRKSKQGEKYLCAYIIAKRKAQGAELRAFLAKDLPDYMIPSYFV
ncbi:MAG: amino acid adenylation domain-containing protein, partial [Candidatus Aminicenantes bacterium]